MIGISYVDRICFIEMQNPEKLNCLSNSLCNDMMHALKEAQRRADAERLLVSGPVLGLAQKVRGNPAPVDAAVRQHRDLARPSHLVDGHISIYLALRRRHECIARSCDLLHLAASL